MSDVSERKTGPALMRGLRNQCPSCGTTKLFARWLKPVKQCGACGQDWTHQQADDFPAYIVMILVGHIVLPIAIEVNFLFDPPMLFQMLFWPTMIAVLALIMLQPVKGAVIAYQWARRMHGFVG